MGMKSVVEDILNIHYKFFHDELLLIKVILVTSIISYRLVEFFFY